ncbi:hypothetical protein PQG44_04990 [Aquirufa sp. LEPPI-3A]|uniref:hypothetical protein n=1 Tax=Aquirufa regiilacus TaxID=3024868 RepID=UPI0028DEFAD2|nr:hypothetical protein [Aquirufa sp. LEPPI-3A]MDT8887018.1 hypothetical protein [Aquirufa sp. LEPPI-3A]
MKKILLLLCLVLITGQAAMAQMPHDGIYMNKKLACGAVIYGNSSWTNFWENQLFRDNKNIGRLTTESVSAMLAYGITKKLNVIAVVPYVRTNASKGNLMGQEGLQDASLWLKVKGYAAHGLTLHGVVGLSVPVSNYVPDFLPMSIGIGSKALITRGMISYDLPKHLYLNSSIAYQMRSNVRADRDGYLAGSRFYNTSDVAVPDAFDAALRLGYLKKDNQLELFAEHFSCVGGDHIRRNDMPFITNDMTMTSVGVYGKFQPKTLGVNARVAYVVDGQNVGQSLSLSVGVLYQFKL